MRTQRSINSLGLLTAALVGLSCATVSAQDVPQGVVMFNAANTQWLSDSGTPGGGIGSTIDHATIYGDPAKDGPYLYLTRPRPARLGEGPSSRPHTHPDARTYVVISGTWYVGFGTELDESKLIALPAGSFYTEPAGVPHFVLVKDENTIVQIGGTGPTRVNPFSATIGSPGAVAANQGLPEGVVLFSAANIPWLAAVPTPGGGLSGGQEQATIFGDASKPGPYRFLMKAHPSRLGEAPSSRPHSHPDMRTYTVVSGTWYVGFGTQLDESKLIALPAGSYYTEPAGVPHFVVVKDENTIVQITGTGPTRVIPAEQAAN